MNKYVLVAAAVFVVMTAARPVLAETNWRDSQDASSYYQTDLVRLKYLDIGTGRTAVVRCTSITRVWTTPGGWALPTDPIITPSGGAVPSASFAITTYSGNWGNALCTNTGYLYMPIPGGDAVPNEPQNVNINLTTVDRPITAAQLNSVDLSIGSLNGSVKIESKYILSASGGNGSCRDSCILAIATVRGVIPFNSGYRANITGWSGRATARSISGGTTTINRTVGLTTSPRMTTQETAGMGLRVSGCGEGVSVKSQPGVELCSQANLSGNHLGDWEIKVTHSSTTGTTERNLNLIVVLP